MLEQQVHAVVVADARGRAVGILTDTDVTERAAAQPFRGDWRPVITAAPLPVVASAELMEDLRQTSARRAMQSPVHAVAEEDPPERAFDTMLRNGVHHVPVLRGGRAVGMLSRLDLLRHLFVMEGRLTA